MQQNKFDNRSVQLITLFWREVIYNARIKANKENAKMRTTNNTNPARISQSTIFQLALLSTLILTLVPSTAFTLRPNCTYVQTNTSAKALYLAVRAGIK